MSVFWLAVSIVMTFLSMFIAYWVFLFRSKTVDEPDFMHEDRTELDQTVSRRGQILNIEV